MRSAWFCVRMSWRRAFRGISKKDEGIRHGSKAACGFGIEFRKG
jgi:hypothetical protein